MDRRRRAPHRRLLRPHRAVKVATTFATVAMNATIYTLTLENWVTFWLPSWNIHIRFGESCMPPRGSCGESSTPVVHTVAFRSHGTKFGRAVCSCLGIHFRVGRKVKWTRLWCNRNSDVSGDSVSLFTYKIAIGIGWHHSPRAAATFPWHSKRSKRWSIRWVFATAYLSIGCEICFTNLLHYFNRLMTFILFVVKIII